MTDAKKKLLADFADALGALTADALNDLNEENRTLLAQALASGGGDVRMLVVPAPLSICCFLRATSVNAPPHILFSIAPGQTAGVTQ